MVVDRYTKGVLTVIAVCLVYQCVMSAGKAVQADAQSSSLPGGIQPVVIVASGELSYRTGQITMATHRDANGDAATDPTLPVRLPNSKQSPLSVAVESAPAVKLTYSGGEPLPVAINAIQNTGGAWQPIRSQVEGQPMGAVPGPPRP